MVTRLSVPVSGTSESGPYLQKNETQVSLAYRYLHARRHFKDNNVEVIPPGPHVELNTIDLSFTYQASLRNSLSLSIPYIRGTFDRGFGAGGPNARSISRSSGLGDVALTYRRWMLDPSTHVSGNYRLAFGLKFPTGDYDQRNDRPVNIGTRDEPIVATMSSNADVAIQPGDSGFGLIFGFDGFKQVQESLLLYGDVTYLANPREKNDMNNQEFGPGPYVPNDHSSVPDYYLARGGGAFPRPFGLDNVATSLGLRIEGQPVHDVFGHSGGFRRPGYTLAIEPGLNFERWGSLFSLSVPVTIKRVRYKSVEEDLDGRTSAVSAAFADYNILAGYSMLF
jgi:hypothetical protein